MKGYFSVILTIWFSISCQHQNERGKAISAANNLKNEPGYRKTTDHQDVQQKLRAKNTSEADDTSFVFIKAYSRDFLYDLKYATPYNFLKVKLYDCDECLIRKKVVDALIEANMEFMELGYKIKFFDCYRPLDVQKKMWAVLPKPGFVANPYTKGSVHNRGGAVDITLTDLQGGKIDMGTDFDHFGKESSHNYTDLPSHVLKNRRLLKSIMSSNGFTPIRSEWWHYNYHDVTQFTLSNKKVACPS